MDVLYPICCGPLEEVEDGFPEDPRALHLLAAEGRSNDAIAQCLTPGARW
jgi:hypothetical protein